MLPQWNKHIQPGGIHVMDTEMTVERERQNHEQDIQVIGNMHVNRDKMTVEKRVTE